MFEDLLRGIFKKNGLDHANAKAQYLRGLQSEARNLWQSYRTQNVVVDYSETKTQEAYLLRYFPFYTLLVEKELGALKGRGISVPDVELLEACLFGCGPGPEVIGLMKHLKNSNAKTTMLIARMADIATEEWSYAREICREFVVEPLWVPGLFECEVTATSLYSVQSLDKMNLEDCHIAVVQNCLNEVPDNSQEETVQNILGAFNRLQTGAIALVIDRGGYGSTTKMMKMMVDNIAKFPRLEVINYEPEKTLPVWNLLSKPPGVVIDNLLYKTSGRGIPREWSGLTFMNKIDYTSISFQIRSTPTEFKNLRVKRIS